MALVVIVIGFAVLAHVIGVVAWPLAGVAALIYYGRDVRRHPSVRCRMCTGSGGHRSRIGGAGFIRRPFGDCWCCGGRKAHPRFAARLLDPEGYKDAKRRIGRGREKI